MNITQEFVDGAKAIVKELDKACKEQKKKIDSMWVETEADNELQKKMQSDLEVMLSMKITAEKAWRSYRHQLNEQKG